MRLRWTRILFVAGLLLFAASGAARADTFTLATIPASGDISGPAGSTIGWGYTITNTSPDYLEFSAFSAGAFLNGTPVSLFDIFQIIKPGATVPVPFIASVQGLFQLNWDPAAPAGFVNSGTFMLTGDFCTDAACLNMIPNSSVTQTANYSATVTGTTAVPEPGTFLLLAIGLAGIVRRPRHN